MFQSPRSLPPPGIFLLPSTRFPARERVRLLPVLSMKQITHDCFRRLALYLLLVFSYCPSPAVLLERGFVYCPAYPCVCESDNGALVVNCQYLYLTQLPKFLAFDGRIRTLSLKQNSIRQLPARAFQGLHVESLDLTENVISHVHDQAFEGLEDSLEELRLQVCLFACVFLPSTYFQSCYVLQIPNRGV